MPATASYSHHNRHFKTLIALVLAMTGGTLLLFWLGHLSPVTPLRSQAAMPSVWTDITVRAQQTVSPRGFFHYRIDEAGRVFQSYAWKVGQHEKGVPGAVQILLTCPDRNVQLSPSQVAALSHILSDLRSQFAIPTENVHVQDTYEGVNASGVRSDHLRRT